MDVFNTLPTGVVPETCLMRITCDQQNNGVSFHDLTVPIMECAASVDLCQCPMGSYKDASDLPACLIPPESCLRPCQCHVDGQLRELGVSNRPLRTVDDKHTSVDPP